MVLNQYEVDFKMAKEKLNPFKDSKTIEDTIDTRQRDIDNILGLVDALDSHFKTQVVDIIKKHNKGVVDYNILAKYDKDGEENKKYNSKATKEVRDLVNQVYDISNEYHPLKGLIDEKLKDNYFHKQMIDGIYTKHKDNIKKAVGERGFHRLVKKTQDENLEEVTGELSKKIISDVNSEEHGDAIYDYLKKKYDLDPAKINEEHFKRNIDQAFGVHIEGRASKGFYHRSFKKYKKAA